jgi:hypothetical protein
MAAQLALNPALIPDVHRCTLDLAATLAWEAEWRNPGSFTPGPFATQPANTKAIAQIVFRNWMFTFAAFVIERKPFTPGDGIGAKHYDFVFPNVPWNLAICPGTATSPGLGFSLGVHATTVYQQLIPPGYGRPNTKQVGMTRGALTGNNSMAYLSDDATGLWTGPPSASSASPRLPGRTSDFSAERRADQAEERVDLDTTRATSHAPARPASSATYGAGRARYPEYAAPLLAMTTR